MKKHLLFKALLVFVVLLTSSAQAWAYRIKDAKIYYDDLKSQWGTNVVIAFGKGNDGTGDGHGCSVYSIGNITNTKLYYWSGSWGEDNQDWVSEIRFGKTSKTYDWYNYWRDSDTKQVRNLWQLYQTDLWEGVSGNYCESVYEQAVLYKSTGTGAGADLSKQAISTFPDDMNYTQSVYYSVREGAGSYSAALSSGATPAKLHMTSYEFVSGTYNAVSSVSPSDLAAGGTTYTRSFTAAHTATTQITVSNIADGYEFEGWYDAATGGNQLEDAEHLTYTYYPTATCNVYARFRKITYSLAGANWTTSGISWTEGTTRLMTTTDGITYSTTLTGEDTGGSTREFKLIKNQAWDGNAIAANTDGVTSSCINGTLGNSGDPNYNFTLTPYLSGTITISYNSSTKVLSVSCEAPTITFTKDGGEDGTSTQKTYSTTVTSSIETPSKTGYDFEGYWSDDATPIQVIDANGAWIANKSGYTDNSNPCKWTVNANHIFTAHWTEILHDVAVEAGAHGSVLTDEVEDIGIATESGNIGATADEGYHFVNWTLPTGVTAAGGYSETSNPIHINATADSKTITANFEANEYTITLDDRSATTAVSPSSVKATYDAHTLSSSITNPAKTGGYTFAGWYLEYETGSGIGTSQLINTSGSLNASVSTYTDGSGNWVNDGGVTVYARWKANANIGAFNFQYGSGTYYGSTWTVANFGDATNNKRTVDFTMPDPSSKKCYVGWGGDFIATGLGSGSGWSSEIDLTDVRLAPCTSATVGTATGAVGKLVIFDNSSSANLYVGFEPSGYAVGTADRDIALTAGADNFYYTDVVTISSTEADGNFQVKLATSSSYTTCGHGTAENASTVSGRKIKDDANIANGSKGVFQMWNNSNTNNFGLRFVTVYDVKFDLQGHGDAIDDYTDVRYNDKISAPTDPTADGYVFHGWFKEAGCVNEWDFASDVVTTGTTLYAKWTSNIGTIDKTTGTTDGVYRATYGETSISITTAPTNAGYEVEGYYLTYNSGFQSPFSNPIATKAGVLVENTPYTDEDGKWNYEGDAPTIYANWQPKSYTLKLYQNDGTEDYTSITVTMGSSTCDPDITAPTRTGYSFGGYYTEESGGTKVINTDGSKPVTTYFDGSARWQYDGNVDLYAHWTPVALSFTNGAGDGSWSTASNWSPACVPTIEHDVTINAETTISGSAVAKSVTIGSSGKVTIQPTGVLEVAGTVTNTDADKLIINTTTSSQGALICDLTSAPTATVNMSIPSGGFHLIASPTGGVKVSSTFAGSGIYTYAWEEGKGWDRRGYYDDFMGNEAILIYGQTSCIFSGILSNACGGSTRYTAEPADESAQGINMLANPLTAPIRIADMTISNSEDGAVHLYNGSWVGKAPGSAGEAVIPAMQGYGVISKSGGGSVSFTYDTAVRGASSKNAPLNAPKRTDSDILDHITLSVTTNDRKVDLELYENEQFTERIDVGWEAIYMEGDGRFGELYAIADEKMNILATPDLEGTVLGFVPGQAASYTISFEGDGKGYYLNDLDMQESTLIEEGNTYVFTPNESTNATRFVISKTPIHKTTTGNDAIYDGSKARKQMIDGILYIIRDGRIYDATGSLVK